MLFLYSILLKLYYLYYITLSLNKLQICTKKSKLHFEINLFSKNCAPQIKHCLKARDLTRLKLCKNSFFSLHFTKPCKGSSGVTKMTLFSKCF